MLDVNLFDSMRIGLASPEKIREWSHGEVKKPETINYRTLKPERDGLFCERIFGPTRDWECHCGKYKRVRYKGTICDRCGVEVTRAKVRRERMGHIELAAPVSHIWYFKGIPSRMGLLLDMSPRALERVLYFASYIVLDPGNTDLQPKELLTEGQFRFKKEQFGKDSFKCGMGAEAIQALLQSLDLDSLASQLRQELSSSNGQKRVRAIRRLEVVEAFRKSGNKPSWMILNVIPVIPPELRPMVQLDGGRFATSDLNDLYRRVINRNNRLFRLLKLRAPDIIVRNEKRMLQEAVDALIDNGRRGRPVTGPGNRPLKSLSDMLKGKQGRFRQNLLGKRVDYSGRSVIVVGPELKLHQCGLPKEMALELFKPFVMKKLSAEQGLSIKAAKKKVDRATPEVWGVLEDVIKEHPVLLNRAPTLHRLGIQAFEPVLTEGRALKLHPLACTAYNADFDGDQMAIHLPLSSEAQAEARVLMLAANHILAPKDGKPIIVPTQDMVLGTYYLTKIRRGGKGEGKYYRGIDEAIMAYEGGEVGLQTPIRVRVQELLVETSVGRLIFNEKIPKELRYYHQEGGKWHLGVVMNKKELGKLVAACFKAFGATVTAEVIDSVKRLGYEYACKAGMTVGITDCIVPPKKVEILAKTAQKVKGVEQYFQRGFITERERYEKVCGLWSEATEEVAEAMMENMDEFNPIYMMSDSGARGNKQQMRQLAGMRGLMADPSGKIIDLPITANFREGLSVSDYFISSHGARKGLADTALRTADSGYLTRRLVDVAQDVIVREDDCDIEVINLVFMRAALAEDTFDALELLSEKLIGRVVAEDIGKVILADTILDEEKLIALGESGASSILLRGNNLRTERIYLGTRERALLLEKYLRTFEGKELVSGEVLSRELFLEYLSREDIEELSVRNGNIKGIWVEAISDGGVIESLRERILGRTLAENIYSGEKLIGRVNELITEELADAICAVRERVKIRSVLTCRSRSGVCKACYGSDLANRSPVEIGEAVGIIAAQSIGEPGTQLTMRTFHTGGVAGGDITQGLPRVEELFEARKPKNCALIAEIGGVVRSGEPDKNGLRTLIIEPVVKSYSLPLLKVGGALNTGDEIKVDGSLKVGGAFGDKIKVDGSLKVDDALNSGGELKVGGLLKVYDEINSGDEIKVGGFLKVDGSEKEINLLSKVGGALNSGDKIKVDGLLKIDGALNSGDEIKVSGLLKVGGSEKESDLFSNPYFILSTPFSGGEVFKKGEQVEGTTLECDSIVMNVGEGLQELVEIEEENQQRREYTIPFGVIPRVKPGDYIKAGDPITDGPKNPHDILRICGLKETHRYLVKEVQKVYKSQGVEINDKHIEVMVRQMLHKVKIEDSGSTEFLPGEFVDMNVFESTNTKAIEEGKEPAVAKPILLGITKASLATDSFLSAASFQETTRVLTDAAIKGKIDPLIGLKENVIIGKLIPAGTGMERYRELTVVDKEATE